MTGPLSPLIQIAKLPSSLGTWGHIWILWWPLHLGNFCTTHARFFVFLHKHRIQRFFTKLFLSSRLFLRNCFQRNALSVSSIDHMLLPGSYQILTSHNIFISKKSNKIVLSFFSSNFFIFFETINYCVGACL